MIKAQQDIKRKFALNTVRAIIDDVFKKQENET